METNMKMAKVIKMTIRMNKEFSTTLVVAVDPIATPKMVQIMTGTPGTITQCEESVIMPLPFALALSNQLCDSIGITNRMQIAC